MKNYIYLIGILLGGLLSSCGTADILTYDQLHPAAISFPAGIRYVGVVNNMPHRDAPLSNDLVLGIVSGEGKTVTEAVAGMLADSKYFDEVVICDSALQTFDADLSVDPVLSSDEIKSLSTNLGVDMLISMEGMWVKTAKTALQYPGMDVPFPVLQATYTPVVRVYLPERSQPLHTFTVTDSIFWDMGTPLSEKMMLEESTKMAASKVVNYLVPSWNQVERIYFSGGCVEMRDAAIYVQEGSWQEAQDLWKELYNRLRKGKTKSKAAFNIALSYEMQGNIDEAREWMKKAEQYVDPKSQEEQIVKQYASVLDRRIQEMVSLKSQMHRFNDNF